MKWVKTKPDFFSRACGVLFSSCMRGLQQVLVQNHFEIHAYMCAYTYTQWSTMDIKKDEMLSFATKWLELEDIMSSETRQTQKDKNVLRPYEHKMLVIRGWEVLEGQREFGFKILGRGWCCGSLG